MRLRPARAPVAAFREALAVDKWQLVLFMRIQKGFDPAGSQCLGKLSRPRSLGRSGRLKDTSSEMMPGFNDRLMAWLPSMIEHRCSIGERGGFFERLRRGTYLAHILEHVTLELQIARRRPSALARPAKRRKRASTRSPFSTKKKVRESLPRAGRELCLAAVHDRPFDVTAEVAEAARMVYERNTPRDRARPRSWPPRRPGRSPSAA